MDLLEWEWTTVVPQRVLLAMPYCGTSAGVDSRLSQDVRQFHHRRGASGRIRGSTGARLSIRVKSRVPGRLQEATALPRAGVFRRRRIVRAYERIVYRQLLLHSQNGSMGGYKQRF